jgi:hypothetical protein
MNGFRANLAKAGRFIVASIQMKNTLRLLIILFSICHSGYAASEVIRIRLEWLNAKDCGLEGCKPQNVIMREGSSMMFGWPEIKGRGWFELKPSLQAESVTLNLKRLKITESNSKETIAEVEPKLSLGSPQNVAIGDVQLKITISKEEPETKMQNQSAPPTPTKGG